MTNLKKLFFVFVKKAKAFARTFWTTRSIPPAMGVLAFVISFFTCGVSGYPYELHSKFDFVLSRRLIHFITGGGEIYGPGNRVADMLDTLSGISLFGVLAFLLLVTAIVLFAICILKKKNGLYIAASVLLILSGISVLFVLEVGTPVSGHGFGGYLLREVFDDGQLGIGTIIWSLLCVLGGAFGLGATFLFKRKTENGNMLRENMDKGV